MEKLVIGITGPTGSGKSTALSVLQRQGFTAVDCDKAYHALLQTDAELRQQLTAAFGEVFLPDGRLNRRKLAERVFGEERELERLNAIVYPKMSAYIQQKLLNCSQKGLAIDAVNLLQSGLGKLCHITVGVIAPEATRLCRIMERDGLDEVHARARIAAQKPDSYYRRHCTFLLENRAESSEAFAKLVESFFEDIFGCRRNEKMEWKEFKEKVMYAPKNGYDRMPREEHAAMQSYCESYKAYLDAGKTEREAVAEGIRLAEEQGFKPFVRGMELKAGDRIYKSNRGKMLLLAVIGTESLAKGIQITAAHVDSPRLDLKPTPLYEEAETAYLKTHYYGGIRKYQWVTIPLELHGAVALKDGTVVNVAIGQGNEPKLIITDLLPHLAAEQNKKSLNEGINGEQLNLIIGSEPVEGDESDRVKLAVMKKLYEKYGFTEDDLISAELEAVPATNAFDVGLDGSLIGAYGHDDRVCAYAALKALFDLDKTPAKTSVCILADKEEIGSVGVSGMQTRAFDTFVEDLCETQGVALRTCLENAFCLSADVTAAFDPSFAEVFERRNSARINYGVGLCKYTGSRGKSGASDAAAELVAYSRRIFDENGVIWQMAELGKVDAGGGGTVAAYMANRNIDTLDAGVPVLSMHAPIEVVSKLDCYMTYKAMKAVYEN